MLKTVTATLFITTLAGSVSALADAEPCRYRQETAIAFSSTSSNDQLRIQVNGDTCESAELEIQIFTEEKQLAYDYRGMLSEHLPYPLTGDSLKAFIPAYLSRLSEETASRTTRNLPAYSNPVDFYEYTNDFVTIDPKDYEALRHQDRAVVWHTTGNASWVHLVYDGTSGKSKVIMRGGVFSK